MLFRSMLVTANAALILVTRSARSRWQQLFTRLTPTSIVVLTTTAAALLAVTAWPVLSDAFRFSALPAHQWLLSFCCGLLMLPLFQLIKRVGHVHSLR